MDTRNPQAGGEKKKKQGTAGRILQRVRNRLVLTERPLRLNKGNREEKNFVPFPPTLRHERVPLPAKKEKKEKGEKEDDDHTILTGQVNKGALAISGSFR